MGSIGRIIKTSIDNFIISTVEKLFGYNLKAEVFSSSGDDSPGLENDRVYLGTIEGQGQSVILGHISISQGANPGEKILYSRDQNGELKSKIYLKNNGGVIIDAAMDIEIKSDTLLKLMNGTDFAVRYNELKTQLDLLKTDLNNLITSYNSHTHTFNYNAGPTPASGNTAVGLPVGVPSTVDFSNIKVSDINLPGVGE